MITSLGPAPSLHQLTIEFGHDSTGDKYHYGELFDTNTDDGEIKITQADGVSFMSLVRTPYGTIQPGGWSMPAPNIQCSTPSRRT